MALCSACQLEHGALAMRSLRSDTVVRNARKAQADDFRMNSLVGLCRSRSTHIRKCRRLCEQQLLTCCFVVHYLKVGQAICGIVYDELPLAGAWWMLVVGCSGSSTAHTPVDQTNSFLPITSISHHCSKIGSIHAYNNRRIRVATTNLTPHTPSRLPLIGLGPSNLDLPGSEVSMSLKDPTPEISKVEGSTNEDKGSRRVFLISHTSPCPSLYWMMLPIIFNVGRFAVEEREFEIRHMVYIGVAIFIIWAIVPSGFWLFGTNWSWSERGQSGDMFGSINALFSGWAFAGVICAIVLQKRELKLQRKVLETQNEELELTRKEIKGQKEQLEAQVLTLKRQNFEHSFFQLLDFHNKMVASLSINLNGRQVSGRSCFTFLLSSLDDIRGAYSDSGINYIWRRFFQEYQPLIGHYFRCLYNIVKFVDQQDIFSDFNDQKRYTNLIRAQLSSNELGLLFYNCLSKRGSKFKDLVEKYALLEDMDETVLWNEEDKGLFEKEAFGQPADC